VIRVIAALAAVCACSHPAAPERASASPKRGPTVTSPAFPNVHAHLRLTQEQPAAPPRIVELEIWLRGSRFRVRDLAGRRFEEIDADLKAPRGLGVPARSMEDFMDRSSAARRPPRPPTELYGDLATGDGWIFRAGTAPRSEPAAELAHVAEQILAHGKDAGLRKIGDVTVLGRAAAEYRGTASVTEDGTPYHNEVYRVIAAPYLLVEKLHDSQVPGLSYQRELISLDEGSVGDADLAPPAGTRPP
jgi:hypothetical protein